MKAYKFYKIYSTIITDSSQTAFEIFQLYLAFLNRFKFDEVDLSLTMLKLWKKKYPYAFFQMKRIYKLKAFL